MTKIILVDLDGPLADFEGGFLKIWRERFPNEFFIPTEKRTKFYLTDEYPKDLTEKIESIRKGSGFFENLPPVEEGVRAIKEMTAAGFGVFICSSGIYANKNCLTEKKVWIERYLGKDLAGTAIFTRDKSVIKGNYLVDDRPAITGAAIPEWKRIIFDQPFNRDIEDGPRMKSDWSNWKEVITP